MMQYIQLIAMYGIDILQNNTKRYMRASANQKSNQS